MIGLSVCFDRFRALFAPEPGVGTVLPAVAVMPTVASPSLDESKRTRNQDWPAAFV
jgi:hypothetical protein